MTIKPYASAFLLAALLSSNPTMAQDDTSSAARSLLKSINPITYLSMTGQLLGSPLETLKNPVSVCAQCHTGEDVARYQTSLGPMLQMVNPVNWVKPDAYTQMAAPLVDPETYKKYYDAWIEKYGNLIPTGTEKTE